MSFDNMSKELDQSRREHNKTMEELIKENQKLKQELLKSKNKSKTKYNKNVGVMSSMDDLYDITEYE